VTGRGGHPGRCPHVEGHHRAHHHEDREDGDTRTGHGHRGGPRRPRDGSLRGRRVKRPARRRTEEGKGGMTTTVRSLLKSSGRSIEILSYKENRWVTVIARSGGGPIPTDVDRAEF